MSALHNFKEGYGYRFNNIYCYELIKVLFLN